MKKNSGLPVLIAGAILLFSACKFNSSTENMEEGKFRYDGPAQTLDFEIERTKDPITGKVPWQQLRLAIEATDLTRKQLRLLDNFTEALSWSERGPVSDVPGPSNGNTRANGGIPSGRVRAIMVDSSDATHKTVFVGSVAGGLWKTSDITVSPANWVAVDERMNNLAIADIARTQDQGFKISCICVPENLMEILMLLGSRSFKSVDGGTTWVFFQVPAHI
ncbi:MAG: hypothetical protein IPH18_09360 [Chitinophagaceae bacterium]|nr:hypothetical protein [Chitinophagaceae bacterium]